jgi:acyl carrier protein
MNEAALNHEAAIAIIRESIERVAPDIDADQMPTDADMRIEAELDSMDFIAVLSAIKESTGVDVPESETGRVNTIDGCADYLVTHSIVPRAEPSV